MRLQIRSLVSGSVIAIDHSASMGTRKKPDVPESYLEGVAGLLDVFNVCSLC